MAWTLLRILTLISAPLICIAGVILIIQGLSLGLSTGNLPALVIDIIVGIVWIILGGCGIHGALKESAPSVRYYWTSIVCLIIITVIEQIILIAIEYVYGSHSAGADTSYIITFVVVVAIVVLICGPFAIIGYCYWKTLVGGAPANYYA